MTFGLTPSSSPFSRRQRMFWIVSPPHPKLAAFQPKKFCFQLASRSRIIGRAPAAGDGVALEIDVDAALAWLSPAAGRGRSASSGRFGERVIGRSRPEPGAAGVSRAGAASMVDELVGPGDEVLPVRTVRVSAVVLAPGEWPSSRPALTGGIFAVL